MNRRHLLVLAGTAALGGCLGTETLDQVGDSTPTPPPPTDTPTATATPTATPSPTATAKPALFELVDIKAPFEVTVGEPYTFAFTVRNTGAQAGEFTTRIEWTIEGGRGGESDVWREEIPPGETVTLESRSIRESQATLVTYRITAFDREFDVVVVAADTPTPYPTPTPTKIASPTPVRPTQFAVEVEYEGYWQGSVSIVRDDESTTTSFEGGGAGQKLLSGRIRVISANAQKQDDSDRQLRIWLTAEGKTVAEATTSAAYGVAQVSKRFY